MASKRQNSALIAALTIITIFCFFQNQRTQIQWPFHTADNVDWSRFAYIQYVTNSEYLCNSLMFFEALQRYPSRADRLMMVPSAMLAPDMVNASDTYLLNKARDEYNVKIVPIAVQSNWEVEPTWAESYTKLLAFNQTQYDRVLSIDSDSILLQPMDELFLLPPAPVALPRAYWLSPERVVSSHIMLVEPSQTEMARVMDKIQSAKNGEFDMEIINKLYGDNALIIPHRHYALLTGEFRHESHAAYLGSDVEIWDPAAAYNQAKLIHFSDWPVPKPWIPTPEEIRLEAQPNCTKTGDGVEDCAERIIWNSLYTDFRTKRSEICEYDADTRESALSGTMLT